VDQKVRSIAVKHNYNSCKFSRKYQELY